MDSGNNAWILTSTALVLLMTLPGLALFYGGMVRRKNVLSTLMQSLGAAAIVTVVWALVAYSLAFTDGGGLNAFVGGLSSAGLAGITPDSMSGDLPENLFLMFQLTFAIITVAIIAGAAVERIRFSAFMVFGAAWLVLVYAPICHWVWGGGFLGEAGVLDFAGGAVVHINAGVAGLVLAKFLGPRKGYPGSNLAPDNLVLTVAGAGFLWVGWFGFNGGSALAADGAAAHALVTTQVATATAVIVWICLEWILRGKASVLGAASGAVAGLVAITPAAGFVPAWAAFLVGAGGSFGAYWGVTALKKALKIDDTLDAFGLHGVGGLVGAILTGVFASEAIGGTPGAIEGNLLQVWTQAWGALAAAAYCGVVTFIILFVQSKLMTLRVDEESEVSGLDTSLHGESVGS
ncbi:MAG: ammonium transporter [Alphaproteobacteria bacterium]|jgi:ammonium transporter, Amt family|uniref:ammonium transporter n=1 Tax=Maricaulis alexandrii TaxID=2570354 RepID=UPI001109F528|nr:ammonium transporter [Maricaulis alexandrii]MCR9267099.1 ammonium transporter [Alphaproteobacteria bacterium]